MKAEHPLKISASINADNKIPLYHQVFLLLKSKINDGEYRHDDYLPSERDLSEIFKVSRITTMRALNELAAGGFVVRETGRGTRVRFTGHGTVIHGAAPGLENGGPEWPGTAMQPIEIKVMEFGYQPATPRIAEVLHIKSGASVQLAVRVLQTDGEPFAHLTSYVAAKIGRQWTAADMGSRPLHQILDELDYPIKQVDESVTATLADMTLSEQLRLSVGAPLIKILRTTYSNAKAPIVHLSGLYRPDHYRYQVSLSGSALPAQGRTY